MRPTHQLSGFEGDPSFLENACEPLHTLPPLSTFNGFPFPVIHSGRMACGPMDCEVTLDWWIHATEPTGAWCEAGQPVIRYANITFPLQNAGWDGSYSACVSVRDPQTNERVCPSRGRSGGDDTRRQTCRTR